VEVQLFQPVRRKEVFLLQATSPHVNDHLLELVAFADDCRRAATTRIAAVMLYFGCGRADKRTGRCEPIMARLAADLLQAVSVDHVVTVDPHIRQVEGFFHARTAVPMLCQVIGRRLSRHAVVVPPDVGRMRVASPYAECLGVPLTVLHKRRLDGAETDLTHVVGNVPDRPCLIVDDMISTGGTIEASIDALLAAGARPEVAATHGLFVQHARGKLSHPGVQNVFVTDSIPPRECQRAWPQLRVISVAPLLSGAIRRIVADGSLGELRELPRQTKVGHERRTIS
jgi:ribose-phosphate pyrophosphokinase